MKTDAPEPLWREIVGDTEPWRRGRMLLVSVAFINLLGQVLIAYSTMLVGAVEVMLFVAVTILTWWLLFAFIWFGTHWLRFLLGGLTLLIGFAQLIWAVRDGATVRLIPGTIDFLIGGVFFAPSVHFFAVRQREIIRWPEKLAVAVVFALLFASFAGGFLALTFHSAAMREEAEQIGDGILQRLVVQNDTKYLFDHASESLRHRYGTGGLSALMTRKYMMLGDVHALHVAGTRVRTVCQFPATFGYVADIDGQATAKCGTVRSRVQILRASDGWQVNGFAWECSAR